MSVASLALGTATPAAAQTRQVPPGFMGVMADGPLLGDELSESARNHEFDTMARSGVESMRVTFYWAGAQPYRSIGDVPSSELSKYLDGNTGEAPLTGPPTNYAATDRLVEAAARRGIQLLPNVLEAPRWAAKHPGKFGSPPTVEGQDWYASYLSKLVRRYGRNGTFWAAHPDLPKVPVRDWQIWNEPNLAFYWSDQPFAHEYVALANAARGAIKGADPAARVVLAGLVNRSWEALGAVYAAGGGGTFDVAAIHPFARKPKLSLEILRRARTVMRQNGDGAKRLIVSELTWQSSIGRMTNPRFLGRTTESGQAKLLREAYLLLAAKRRSLRLDQVFWITWLTRDQHRENGFDYAGLRRLEPAGHVTAKPAFKAYRSVALKLEGCRSKTTLATSCVPR